MDLLAVPVTHIAIALLVALLIAVTAVLRRLLDSGGAVAASLLGPALVASGGWWAGILLVAFFASASLLSASSASAPARTWRQVLANGGAALGFCAAGLAIARPALLLAAAATLAAATADTWATEVGRRRGGPPVSIRTGRRVPSGTSGAISRNGTVASAIGAIFMALLAVALADLAPAAIASAPWALVVIAISGFAGSVIDSVLGAMVQGQFVCQQCGAHSESPRCHRQPGHEMMLVSGIPWISNSVVNFVATLTAGVLALFLVRYVV